MPLPHDVLSKLSSLSGYDQMLEMDTISREHSISLAEIEIELAAFNSGSQPAANTGHMDDFVPAPYKEDVDLSAAQPVVNSPTYIERPDQYRMKYDPSEKGMDSQSQVRHAIICPACSCPLGIPDVRPIKVTCPQCMHEAIFYD
jgi:hypothetical protein|tara:strand:- start:1395 stop:1826 length:432 start_codon:yes stop_codon:yes gene_type:complete